MLAARKKPRRTDYMLRFSTVRYWQGQLNKSGVRHEIGCYSGTKSVYLFMLTNFNEWLPGRAFDIRQHAVQDGRIVRVNAQKSFANVEELLRFGEDGNEKDVRKIISLYLVDPLHEHLSRSTLIVACAAIKSYFDVHDVITHVKLNGRKRAYEVGEEPETDAGRVLQDDYAQQGKPVGVGRDAGKVPGRAGFCHACRQVQLSGIPADSQMVRHHRLYKVGS